MSFDRLHRNQNPETAGPYVLYYDDKEVITGTLRECSVWIMTHGLNGARCTIVQGGHLA